MRVDSQTFKWTERGRLSTVGLVIGVIGLAASVGGYMVDPERFYHAWLTGFAYWVSLALAGLFFTMLHHLTAARWSVVVRRISETLMIQLPWLVLAAVPVVLGVHELYHWSHPEAVAHDPGLQHKAAYLNVGFFTLRTVVFFVVWSLFAFLLYRASLRQDNEPDGNHIERMRKISAGGMILFALTVTFAAFDWLMSLNPHWFSTIFGVYYFGGLFLSGVSLMTIICLYLRFNGVLKEAITVEHYHDLGKLMFAFVVFWSYIGFSQYLLIWYGNLPEETHWFLARWKGSWKAVSLLIVFGHFAVPFVVMIFRNVKRTMGAMWFMATWFLFIHWVDMYWLVYPTLMKDGAQIGWIEFAPTIGLGGIFVSLFWTRFTSQAAVPVSDPYLKASLEFVNQ